MISTFAFADSSQKLNWLISEVPQLPTSSTRKRSAKTTQLWTLNPSTTAAGHCAFSGIRRCSALGLMRRPVRTFVQWLLLKNGRSRANFGNQPKGEFEQPDRMIDTGLEVTNQRHTWSFQERPSYSPLAGGSSISSKNHAVSSFLLPTPAFR